MPQDIARVQGYGFVARVVVVARVALGSAPSSALARSMLVLTSCAYAL
jgi:hypothetical protein